MSRPLDHDQFLTGVVPVPPSEQALMDITVRLAMSACLAPRIRHGRTANFYDIELRRQRIDMVLAATLDYVVASLSELNENLPVTDILDTDYLLGPLKDMRSEIGGALEKRMGE